MRISRALPPAARHGRVHAATRSFQAIRMVVNDELGELARGLDAAPPMQAKLRRAGDLRAVEILDVQLRQDWGWNMIKPLSGTLPDDFHETRVLNIPLDRARMVGRMPWGLDLPLKPFFGVMGVSPPPAWGRITSLIPRARTSRSATASRSAKSR